MTHDQERSTWIKEGLAALIGGSLYGITSVIVGHPLDTVKTQIHCDPNMHTKSMTQVISHIYKTTGLLGFYKGALPPLLGSGVFRSLQFGVFEAFYTKTRGNAWLTQKIPFSGGIEYSILLGGFLSGITRSLIETPVEYVKVNGQLNSSWKVRQLFQGFKVNTIRAVGILTYYFAIIDTFRRKTKAFESKPTTFLVNGFCGSTAFVIIWPLEIVKNQVQSKEPGKYSIIKMLKRNVQQDGILKGFFSGSLPGIGAVFFRNGCSMIVMQWAQKKLTEVGFRK